MNQPFTDVQADCRRTTWPRTHPSLRLLACAVALVIAAALVGSQLALVQHYAGRSDPAFARAGQPPASASSVMRAGRPPLSARWSGCVSPPSTAPASAAASRCPSGSAA